jgi:hypothetical protein
MILLLKLARLPLVGRIAMAFINRKSVIEL